MYHHIQFDQNLVQKAILSRREEYRELSDEFIELAVRRFFQLRESGLKKPPATSELLTWLRVLAIATDREPAELKVELEKLPHLGTLLKDRQDFEELEGENF